MIDNQTWLMHEYAQLRQEVLERAKLLHLFILIASLTYLPLFITVFWLMTVHTQQDVIITFLLTIPLLYAALTYNYQSNQMTLEAVAKYIATDLKTTAQANKKEAVLGWDNFYGHHKLNNRLTSFLKVTPLLFPLLIPLWITIAGYSAFATPTHTMLTLFDSLLFILVLINFRYKIS